MKDRNRQCSLCVCRCWIDNCGEVLTFWAIRIRCYKYPNIFFSWSAAIDSNFGSLPFKLIQPLHVFDWYWGASRRRQVCGSVARKWF
jgi:hypothetical protein